LLSNLIVSEDVAQEKERLSSPLNKDLIKVQGLQKVYPNGVQALNDVTFGVEEGQIFGLLGPNGAGKSTTFNILSAVLPKSFGSARLLDQEIDRDIYEVFDQVGICPQVNPIWSELTTVDHLKVIAKMKGVEPNDIPILIDYFLNALELKKFANTKAGGLSGGNKRKLCVAMCLIGAPKLQFLDEPSTGVDPIARKYLWNCLKECMKGRKGAMILTTHYMQEAESISSKLGIIINGTMSCVGKISDLKRNFGEYTIMIRTNKPSSDPSTIEIQQLMSNILPQSRISKSSGENALFFKVYVQKLF
jgi:ATP-binding cassette subfamily A (ABC1) protein 3